MGNITLQVARNKARLDKARVLLDRSPTAAQGLERHRIACVNRQRGRARRAKIHAAYPEPQSL
jgi:hypothetical protein